MSSFLRTGSAFAYLWVAAMLCALAILSDGCTERDRPEDHKQSIPTPAVPQISGVPTFTLPPLPEGCRYDSVVAADLDSNKPAEYLVTSLSHDSLMPPGARANVLQIFHYDATSQSFIPVLTDTVQWILHWQLRDLTGDGYPEIIVTTNAGGHDRIATNGLRIYGCIGGRATTFRTMLNSRTGDPTIEKLTGSSEDVVVIHGAFWPAQTSHTESVRYTEDIRGLRDGEYVSVNDKYRQYYLDAAQQQLTAYAAERKAAKPIPLPPPPAMDSLGQPLPVDSAAIATADSLQFRQGLKLYFPAALAMLAFHKAGAAHPLRTFWDSEQAFLRKQLTLRQFNELAGLYTKLIGL